MSAGEKRNWKRKRAREIVGSLSAEERAKRIAILKARNGMKLLIAAKHEIKDNANFLPSMAEIGKSAMLARAKKFAPSLRAVNLAYGFLRGVPYSTMEQKCYTMPNWDAVEALTNGITIGANNQRFEDWKNDAIATGAYQPREIVEPGIKVTLTLRGNLLSRLQKHARDINLPLTATILSTLDMCV